MEKKKEQTAFQQLTMLEAETKVKVWDINDPHAMRIHKLVGEMIAMDNRPSSHSCTHTYSYTTLNG